ncbi:MAG: hypothetical protein EP332_02955 [Bacteroidetes bacterium]|nr:MAG: hypothetical protein EP332_02955 [Bacteroidota bacterium]
MKRVVLAFLLLGSISANAQDELLAELEQEEKKQSSEPVFATFKGTRLINFSTVEIQGKNTLEFRIAHRFGDAAVTNSGNNLFGLDGPVAMQLAFDYSLSDRLSLGIGRTNVNKLIDGNIKYRLLRQTTDGKMPISVTLKGQVNVTHAPERIATAFDKFTNRMSYVNQVMVARKFNSKLSLQANFIHLHYNLVRYEEDFNTVFAAAIMGRYKITKRMAVTAEYGMPFGNYYTGPTQMYNPLSVGLDIETGGHVFQVFFTNAFSVNEAQFLPYNDRSWGDGQFRWGFNVSRVFSL